MANALGLERDDYSLQDKFEVSLKPLNTPERFQDMVLMKKLKSPPNSKKRKELMKKLEEHGYNTDVLDKKERELYERLRRPESTSAPFVKEFITFIECLVYIMGEEEDLWILKNALENPKRPLYIGGSDDFVIVSVVDNKLIDVEEIKSDELDSIVRINGGVTPIDKTRIVGRVPYRFNEINKRKRDYSREDAVVAAPPPGEKLKLTRAIRCFKVFDEHVAF